MKITEYGSIKSTGNIKKRANTSSVSGFSDLLDMLGTEETNAPAAMNDVAATAALSNLLALQEISEEDVQRKKLLQQGNNLLDSLDNLRKQLLMGEIPLHTLQDLQRQLTLKKQFISDPRLTSLIEDIELRAAVELAKLQMAAKDNS